MIGLKTTLTALWILTAPAFGCAHKETVYRSIYDGLQTREEIVHPEPGPKTSSGTSFDTYRREREEILNPPD